MATVFSTATLGLNVDSKQFVKELSGAQQATVKALNDMQAQADAFSSRWRDITGGIKDTKRVVSGILISQGFYAIMNALTGAAAAAAQFATTMEQASVSLEYFVDSAAGTEEAAAKVSAYLREVNEFAARTPFNTNQVLNLSRYMQSVGVAIGQTQSVLTVLTDAAAATGATSENLERIVFALGQMLTKGRVANEEIRQLANANIPIYDILQEELNLTGKQISNIGKYWVDADKAVVAILNGLNKRYQGAADRIAETFTGMLDTIVDDAKIVANEAFSSLYAKLKEATGTLRDTLDEWRNIVTEKGAPGLFNDVVLRLDPTGQLGNDILAAAGNLLQLKDAFIDLYHASSPVLSVVGKSLSTATNTGLIALTALTKTVDGLITSLDKMGISTSAAGKGIASLYVAYKATQLVSLLGQALASMGMSAYNAASGLVSILPASISARAGVVALTASVATLVAYLASAAGLFGTLNNGFAGLSQEAGTSGLNANWQQAYEQYLAQMEEYNAAVDAYRQRYEESYSTMGNPDDVSVKSTKDPTNSSKSTEPKVQDWVAAFDEVYDVPNEEETTEDQLDKILGDFTDLIDLLETGFNFPDVVDLPEKPTFEFGDVFGDSIWDSVDAPDASFWLKLLPSALVGLTAGLGKVFAKQKTDLPTYAKDADLPTGTKVSSFAEQVVLDKRLKDLTDNLSAELRTLGESADALQSAIRRSSATPESTDELDRLTAKVSMQLQDTIKTRNAAFDTAALLSKEAPIIADADRALNRISDTLDTGIARLTTHLGILKTQGDITVADLQQLAHRRGIVEGRHVALGSGVTSNVFDRMTQQELADALDQYGKELIDTFKRVFTGPLGVLEDGIKGYDVSGIQRAATVYGKFLDIADKYSALEAVSGKRLETIGTSLATLVTASNKKVGPALDLLVKQSATANMTARSLDSTAAILAADLPDGLDSVVKAVNKADIELRDFTGDLLRRTPMVISEREQTRRNRVAASAMSGDAAAEKQAGDLLTKLVQVDENIRINRLQNAAYQQDTLKQMLHTQADIRSGLKFLQEHPPEAIQRQLNEALARREYIKRFVSEQLGTAQNFPGGVSFLTELQRAAEQAVDDTTSILYTAQQIAGRLRSDRRYAAIRPQLSEDVGARVDAYKALTDAIERTVPHLTAATATVEAVRDTLTRNVVQNYPAIAAGLKELKLQAADLVATGTKFQVIARGMDDFSGSLSTLTAGVLRLADQQDAASTFVKQTAALGVALEPLMRRTLALSLRPDVGIVSGTGHAAIPFTSDTPLPVIVQNDASIAFYKDQIKHLSGSEELLESIGVDFKVTSENVLKIFDAQAKLGKLNGIPRIAADALLAANKPGWYYEFIPHLRAFGAENSKEVISILNRDFDFRRLGSEIAGDIAAAIKRGSTAGNADFRIGQLEGRYLSADALQTYADLHPMFKGVDWTEIAQSYAVDVIIPAFTNPVTGAFNTDAFKSLMSEYVLEYGKVAVDKTIALSNAYFDRMLAASVLARSDASDMLSEDYLRLTTNGTTRYTSLPLTAQRGRYRPFTDQRVQGWFEQLLGEGALDGITYQGAFTAELRSYIDSVVNTLSSEFVSGESAAESLARFSDRMQAISEAAAQFARGDGVPAALEEVFSVGALDPAQYSAAYMRLSEAAKFLAENPSFVVDTPRLIRTTVEMTNKINAALTSQTYTIDEVSTAVAHYVDTLKRSFKQLADRLHIATSTEAQRFGDQLVALSDIFDGRAVAATGLEAFVLDLPLAVANVEESTELLFKRISQELDNAENALDGALVDVRTSDAKDLRKLLHKYSSDRSYVQFDELMRQLRAEEAMQLRSYVDIETTGIPMSTASGEVPVYPIQISAINPEGELRQWYVNWGELNEEVLDAVKNIEDVGEAFSELTVTTLKAAAPIDRVMTEVYDFLQLGNGARLSGYNATGIGGFDRRVLNYWRGDLPEIPVGIDVMDELNSRLAARGFYRTNMSLVDAYTAFVGDITATAHNASNDILMTVELQKRIADGTVDQIVRAAEGMYAKEPASARRNKLEVLLAAGQEYRNGPVTEAAKATTPTAPSTSLGEIIEALEERTTPARVATYTPAQLAAYTQYITAAQRDAKSVIANVQSLIDAEEAGLKNIVDPEAAEKATKALAENKRKLAEYQDYLQRLTKLLGDRPIAPSAAADGAEQAAEQAAKAAAEAAPRAVDGVMAARGGLLERAVDWLVEKVGGSVKKAATKLWNNYGQYLGLNFFNNAKLDAKQIQPVLDALQKYGAAFELAQETAAKAKAATADLAALQARYARITALDAEDAAALADATSMAKSLGAAARKAAKASDDAYEQLFDSLIVNAKKGLKTAQSLDFDTLGKLLSNGADKVAYYLDTATNEWKIVGSALETTGEDLFKGYFKLVESGAFGDEARKATEEWLRAIQTQGTVSEEVLKQAREHFEAFRKNTVIYDMADDLYYVGDTAADAIKASAGKIEKSLADYAKKLLSFDIAGYSIFDVADIAISGFRQAKADEVSQALVGTYVEGLLSDGTLSLLQSAGVSTGEIVAGNIYAGVVQAVGQSALENGVANMLALAIGGAVGGIPGILLSIAAGTAGTLGLGALLGNDETTKAADNWLSMLAGDSKGGAFGIGRVKPYDTDAFEELLKQYARTTPTALEQINKLVEMARITDTEALIDAFSTDGITKAELDAIVEVVRTAYNVNAVNFATQTNGSTVRGIRVLDELLMGDTPRDVDTMDAWLASLPSTSALRIASATGLVDVTSRTHGGKSDLLVAAETAEESISLISELLGRTVTLGKAIEVDGKQYLTVLEDNAKHNPVQYIAGNEEGLHAALQAVYGNAKQSGDIVEAIKEVVSANPILSQSIADYLGLSDRWMTAVENLPAYIAQLSAADPSYSALFAMLDTNTGLAEQLVQQQLDIWDTYEAAKLAEQAVYSRTSDSVGDNSDIWQGNTARAIIGATLDGLLPTMLAQLAESGLVFSSGQQAYDSAFQEGAVLDYITVGTIAESLKEAFKGATLDLRGLTATIDDTTFNLGDLQVTTAEAEILAAAGIQLNSDGTITMVYSNNGDVTGNERRLSLGQEHFSQDILNALGEYTITIDFDRGELDFGNFSAIQSKMTGAMFKLSDSINSQLSDNMREVFETLGKITEDGFLEITNSAILGGNTSMTTVLDELDWTGVSDVVKEQLYTIAALIDKEGGSIQDNILEWANAVRIPSPIKAEDLTEEIIANFKALGVTFEEAEEEFYMIISNTGERLSNGMTLISAEKWQSLSAEMQAALKQLGVEVTPAGNQVIVDLTHIMDEGADRIVEVFVDQPELWEQLPETFRQYLEESGIVAYNGVLGIKRNIESGLVELTDGWLLELDNFNDETRHALEDKLGVTLESGLIALNGYIEGADIPDTVNREALVPFQELPQEIQDALAQVDENCAQKMYDIKNTASGGFTNLSSVLGEIAGGVASTADDMATSLANAVTRAMASMQQLENLQSSAGRTGGILGIGSKKNNVVYKGTDKLGNSYYGEYTSGGSLVKYIRIDGVTGQESTVSSLPRFATGGVVDPIAASLPILAGELGKEMAIMPNGDTKLLEAGLYNLPAGTQILNADDTKKVQKYAGTRPTVKAFAEGTASLSVSTADGYEYGARDTSLIDYLQADSSLREARGNERSSQMQYFLAEEFELLLSRLDLFRGTFEENTEHMSILLQDAIGAVGDSISNISTQLTTSLLPSGDEAPAADRFLGYDWMAVVEAAKVGWANATTDEEREAWHNLAEMARATQGFSGGADGSDHTDLVAPRGSIEATVRRMLELMTTNSTSVEGYTWASVVQAAQEGYKNAVSDAEREAWHTVAEMARATQGFSGGVDGSSYELLADEHAQTVSLEQTVQLLKALQMWSAAPIETVDGISWQDVVAMAKLGWSVATTDEERSLWHDLAEEARATQGFMGGPAGDALIYLGGIQGSLVTVVDKLQALQAQFNTVNWGSIRGSAHGSIISSEGLYKLGEGGLSEAVIPLERPDVLNKVGAVLGSFMPDSAQGLRAALGVANGGILTPGARTAQVADPATMIDTITRGVLERVLPAVATAQASDESSHTPIYVGTLIADDAGLRTLERKLYTIRQAESMRRG